jgi:transcriptional regulator GlxA family with amidase domain
VYWPGETPSIRYSIAWHTVSIRALDEVVAFDLSTAAEVFGRARLAVMPLERDGGQAQYIAHMQRDAEGSNLEPLLRWIVKNAPWELVLDDIATRATMSSRTSHRRLREQTSTPSSG